VGIRKEKRITKVRKRKKEVNDSDYNISHIHGKVITQIKHPTFYENPQAFEKYAQRIHELIWISKNAETKSEQILAFRMLKEYRRYVRDLEEGISVGWYLLRIHKDLSKIRKRSSRTSFVERSKNIVRQTPEYESFLSVASQFIAVPSIIPRDECSCGGKYQKEENGMVCLGCGNFVEKFVGKSTYCDSSRINKATRNSNTCNVHFNDTVKCFQGKQNTEIPKKVYDLISREMEYNSIPSDKLKKTHIYHFLSTNGYTNYEDINLIHSNITGVPCPDLTEYEEKLFEYHEKLENAYAEIKGKYTNRVSSLNVYFKLYELLKLLGYGCKQEDFFLLKTATKMSEHKFIFSKICEINKWKTQDG
jgi:hypothetical protein